MSASSGQEITDEHHLLPPFPDHVRAVVGELSAALFELLTATGTQPSRPQHVARQLGLDKSLAWKVARLATAANPIAAIPLVPGESGIEILLRAAAKARAPAEILARARDAAAAFDRLVSVHAEDRATLELMANELLPPEDRAERDDAARRLAFQGNSAIFGVRARARFGAYVVAPSAETNLLDLMFVAGLVGFRRIRANARAPLFQHQLYHDDGSPLAATSSPIAPPPPGADGMPILGEFCRPTVPPIRRTQVLNGQLYELTEGPVGRTHSADCVYSICDRAGASAHATKLDQFGEHSTYVLVPIEAVQADLLIHRSLPFTMPPEVSLFGMIPTSPRSPQDRHRDRLPIAETAERVPLLGGANHLDGLETPLFPRYVELMRYALDRVGWNPEEFDAWRVTIRYPPVPSLVLLRFPLPPAPART